MVGDKSILYPILLCSAAVLVALFPVHHLVQVDAILHAQQTSGVLTEEIAGSKLGGHWTVDDGDMVEQGDTIYQQYSREVLELFCEWIDGEWSFDKLADLQELLPPGEARDWMSEKFKADTWTLSNGDVDNMLRELQESLQRTNDSLAVLRADQFRRASPAPSLTLQIQTLERQQMRLQRQLERAVGSTEKKRPDKPHVFTPEMRREWPEIIREEMNKGIVRAPASGTIHLFVNQGGGKMGFRIDPEPLNRFFLTLPTGNGSLGPIDPGDTLYFEPYDGLMSDRLLLVASQQPRDSVPEHLSVHLVEQVKGTDSLQALRGYAQLKASRRNTWRLGDALVRR